MLPADGLPDRFRSHRACRQFLVRLRIVADWRQFVQFSGPGIGCERLPGPSHGLQAPGFWLQWVAFIIGYKYVQKRGWECAEVCRVGGRCLLELLYGFKLAYLCDCFLLGGGLVSVFRFAGCRGGDGLSMSLHSETENNTRKFCRFRNGTLNLSMISLGSFVVKNCFTVLAVICRQQIRAVINFCVH